MQITASKSADVTIAALQGRLDTMTAIEAEKTLLPLVQGGAVIADLSEVGYVSSAGLRVLLKAAKLARSTGARVALCGLQQAVFEVFEISGFNNVISIFPTREQALAG
jgi:anti-anti-sigma factor